MAVAEIRPHESKIYYEFSHLYDRIFTRFFFPRIASTIRSLRIPPGARVLEVGVGTGLSLSAYPLHAEVTGIDLAQEMLDQAQEKTARNGWRHISLLQMDALNMTLRLRRGLSRRERGPGSREADAGNVSSLQAGRQGRDHQPFPERSPLAGTTCGQA